MNLNECFFAGNLGADIEARAFQKEDGSTGYAANFSLAVNEGYGEKKRAVWVNFAVYDLTASNMSKLCRKGDNLFIMAKYSKKAFKKKDGGTGYREEFVVKNWQFTGRKSDREVTAKDALVGGDREPDNFMDIPEGIDEELPFA